MTALAELKRTLFAVDGYFRDGWDDLLEAVAEPAGILHRHATLLLKPEAVTGRRLDEAMDWLLEQDAVIVAAEPVALDRHGARALWGYRWNAATRERRCLAEALATAGESLLVVVRMPAGPVPATARLSDLTGPADPSCREPWQLRHRLGDVLPGEDLLIDFVHTADEPDDLVREFGILLDGGDRRRVYAEMADGLDREGRARELAEELYRRRPAHDLTYEAALARRDAPAEPWDTVILGTAAERPPAPGGAAPPTGVPTGRWEHRPLRYERTLPHPLVHKSGNGEVFLTDHAPGPGGGILLAGELPVAHRYFNDLPVPRLDLMPLLELCRQGCYVVAHAYHGVPGDHRFLLRNLSARLAGPGPAVRRAVIEVTVAGAFTRGLALDYIVRAEDGTELATASSSFSWMDGPAWERLRAAGRARHGLGPEIGAPPRAGTFPAARGVGRTGDANVIVADLAWRRGSADARLALDPANPAMFEQAQGHIPGMTLAEAARQSALWTLSRHLAVPAGQLTVVALETGFSAVGELDAAVDCAAKVVCDRGGRYAVGVGFTQTGLDLAGATVEAVRS
ncbi:AfsA-related hotdog domain-containing protein [Actinocorallia longicatena]|uniref:A-factor biosynthesis hotdog domain-containing protein n=1 Tax=Actinocorallia longicatena TaxID=111803 RepID=A0ABP6Q973_9ACTN